MQSTNRWLLRSSGVIVFLVLWEMAPRLGWLDPYFVSPLSVVLAEAVKLAVSGELPVHLLVSTWRALTGLTVALVIALPLGVVLGRWPTALTEALDPLLRLLSQVNPFTLLPLFLLFFGIGETAKVAVVTWVTLWPILFYTATAARNVDPVQIKTAASMGVSRAQLLLKVILPASVPTIFIGVRNGASLTFFILVAAEMLGTNGGLGWMVHNAAMNYLIPRIYAAAAIIVMLGFLLNRFLLHMEESLFVWHDSPAIFRRTGQPRLSPRRPGRWTLLSGAIVLLLLLIVGGLEVRRVNRESMNGRPAESSHSGHFGTPLEVSPGGL
jgi:NitT/TauT family transport system permease protein